MIAEVLGVTALAGAVVHGAFHRNSPFFGPALGRLPGTARTVALTFDDGPNPSATTRILDTLEEYEVRATFFVLGQHAELWPNLVRRIADSGHSLGNHGYFHERLHDRLPSYVRTDLLLGTAAIQRASDVRPALFRAPHGFRSPWTTAIAQSLGQRTIGWTLGVWDSSLPGADEIVRRVVEGVRPGAIVLLHDGDGYDTAGDRTQTADALPAIVEALRTQGYGFAAIPPS